MSAVRCQDCTWYKEAPYAAPLTGCWHPENMRTSQKEAFLKQQEQPGDHEKINLRGDCARYEARPRRGSLWRRILSRLAG